MVRPDAYGPATVSADTAIVGATVIDGNGGPPLRDATVVVVGERIEAVGPRASVQVPAGASIIDGTGGTSLKFPGRKDKNLNRFKQIAQN